ncbi:phage/plasmid primase, P4 family [Cellulosimicrobium sp. TH-20]|uniref:phage/plasmid primase, P4 family n=1 Tax=Cellulosimicrobium sp. TH-20 TaxID=1980001 RepID=UPI0011A8759E|nr:phage/plasmid primase, P4 family [Cellulosimicrobium sp. TH-20]
MTLADLLDRIDDVEETHDGYLVSCPAHEDSHNSLRLAVSDSGKVIMRCRAGCETSDVVKGYGLTMRDLARMTPGDVKHERAVSQDVPASPADVARLAVRLDGWAADLAPAGASGAEDALGYAADRFGITAEDAERLGLGYAGPARYDADRALVSGLPGGPRLVVPFRDRDGVARGFQARALAADAQVRWLGPESPEGGSWAKVGYFPGASGWDEVFVTEGPGDALTACALGYDAIGVRGAGLASNPAAVDEVVAMIGAREAVIAGDGDPSGQRFSATFARVLAERGVRVKVLPVPEGLDLTDWRAKAGSGFDREVIRAVLAAEPVEAKGAALLAWDESRYSLSDLGGARFLRDYVESIGSGVRFVAELGFFLLDGGVWKKDERQAVRTHAQAVADLVKGLAAEAASDPEAAVPGSYAKARAGRFLAYSKHAQTSRGLDAMLRELQAVQGVPASPHDFDKHADRLAVRNGVVNLRTGELGPHDPSLLLTRRIDLPYSPTARAPRWEQFLREVFPAHADLPEYVRRLVGYGITGLTSEQCFAVLYGKGANGKSVFTDTLTEVFRDITVTTPFSTFEDRPSGGIPNDLAALNGARVVMASEGEAGRPMAEAVLKRVTGRDLIAARFMRKEFFEFRPTFLLMLATNFKPSFRGQDEGLWRRVKLIPWERFFAPHERDHRLGDALLDEAPGILTWAVQGAVQWFAGGLQDPPVISNGTKEYRETSDVLADFVPGRWVSTDEDVRVKATEVFQDFREWADEGNYVDLQRWSARAFYSALEERGFSRRKVRGVMYVAGIRKARPSDHADASAEPATPEPPTQDSPSVTPSPIGTAGLRGADLDAL